MATKEQFEAWDKAGFNGDEFIFNSIKKLCEDHHITTIIETGTRYGNTTKRLASLASTLTCELDKLNFNIAKENLFNQATGKEIAICFNCDSVAMLEHNLKNMTNQRILFYLDAHGAGGTPLLSELEEIAKAGLKPVICIHDFVNPYLPELGFDTYNGQPYNWAWIEAAITKIYGEGEFVFEYNKEYTEDSAKRGIVYIRPLEFMQPRKRSVEDKKAEIKDAIAATMTSEEQPLRDLDLSLMGDAEKSIVNQLSEPDPSSGSIALDAEKKPEVKRSHKKKK